MYKEINMTELFSQARSVSNLLEILEQYQANGIKHIFSYNNRAITIQDAINITKMLLCETSDLEEILRAINTRILN